MYKWRQFTWKAWKTHYETVKNLVDKHEKEIK